MQALEQHVLDDSQPFAMLPSQLYQPLEQVQVGVHVPQCPLEQVGMQLPAVWEAVQVVAEQLPQFWVLPQIVWLPQL